MEHAGGGRSRGGGPPVAPPLGFWLGFRLGRVHRMLREAWGARIADLGLSAPEALTLRTLGDRPGLGLRELARLMRTDAMNVKHLADQLERAGLVSSVADPGHRQRRLLRPSDKGLLLVEELARRATAWNQHLTGRLGPTAQAQLQRLLEDLEEVLEGELALAPSSAAQPAPMPKTRGRR